MTTANVMQLLVLALIDSTSIGTLLIPLWMLLMPQRKGPRGKVLLFLGTLGLFYFALGVLLLSGVNVLDTAVGGLAQLWELEVVSVFGAVVGGTMLAWALFAPGGRGKKEAHGKSEVPGETPVPQPAQNKTTGGAGFGTPSGQGTHNDQASSRLKTEAVTVTESRWTARIGSALNRPAGVVLLALLAGLLELPTMLPYLAALGIVSSQGLPMPLGIAALAGYCVVMLLPALVLLGIRVATGDRLDTQLRKLSSKLSKYAAETLAWVVGIVGFLILRASLVNLSSLGIWNPFGG